MTLQLDPGIPSARVLPAYAEQADLYEQRTIVYQAWRDQAVAQLPATSGDHVIDVGCGTGLCFDAIEQKVGPRGGITGIDESADMLDLAGRRVKEREWQNVTLVESAAERADIPYTADAAVFCAVHDVLQSRRALDNVFAHLRPGAWVTAVGGKWAPGWMFALNIAIRELHAPYIRDFRGFDRPWLLLSRYLDDCTATEVAGGGGFLVIGRARTR